MLDFYSRRKYSWEGATVDEEELARLREKMIAALTDVEVPSWAFDDVMDYVWELEAQIEIMEGKK
jgi:hypothetical protein